MKEENLFNLPSKYWKRPFRYCDLRCAILDTNSEIVFQIRGYGFLTGEGSKALNLPHKVAESIQDELGKDITTLLNKNWPE
jgi:hypothetical protein